MAIREHVNSTRAAEAAPVRVHAQARGVGMCVPNTGSNGLARLTAIAGRATGTRSMSWRARGPGAGSRYAPFKSRCRMQGKQRLRSSGYGEVRMKATPMFCATHELAKDDHCRIHVVRFSMSSHMKEQTRRVRESFATSDAQPSRRHRARWVSSPRSCRQDRGLSRRARPDNDPDRGRLDPRHHATPRS